MDTILPSTGTYKVNAKVDDIFLSDCSFAGSSDRILPFFEETVSNDPDVSGLMIFLKDNKGDIAGWKVIYYLDADAELSREPAAKKTQNDENSGENLEGEIVDEDIVDDEEDIDEIAQLEAKYKTGDEIFFPVKSLDKDMPFFPIPRNVPMGRYTLVFNVLSGDEILQKTEKDFFYLANAIFLFENIQVHFPGIAESSQLVPKGMVIMLETELNFDSRLDPYIIWYDGKSIISEGNFSGGAGNLLWKTPEQSGFFSLRAEVFPIEDRQNLTGYQKDISLLVPSKPVDIHLVSEDSQSLIQWYPFEGSLNDSKMKTSAEHSLIPVEEKLMGKKTPRWMPSGGTYGLATGYGDAYTLPKVSFSNVEIQNWHMLFRFKPLSEGSIFSVKLGPLSYVTINVRIKENAFVLTLSTISESASRVYTLPEDGGFITVGMDFSIRPEHLTAQLDIVGMAAEEEAVSLATSLKGAFEITLGQAQEVEVTDYDESSLTNQTVFTALWDEIAIFQKQFTENEINEDNNNDDLLAILAASVNDDFIN